MDGRPQFLYVTCQVGAEGAVKGEMARGLPAARPAYARPGFLTFKLPERHLLPVAFDLHLVFARAVGFSLGKATGADQAALARAVWNLAQGRIFQRLHVWERDQAVPGERGFEPSITPLAVETARLLRQHCPEPQMLAPRAEDLKTPARRGDTVLDCILVEPDEWWVGFHEAHSVESRWPGGMMSLELPPDAVSRAWLKMEEALRWSQLPIPPGARCAELGASPGGSSQALLGRGLVVLGVDPADIHPSVLAHPNFTHLRKRVTQVRRREMRKVRWLMADMNVAPSYTLDAVESIVTHPMVNIRGMLLTLKLFEWKLADEVPQYLARVQGWGYNVVRARQLQYNRQEICLAALQRPFVRKPPVRPRPKHAPPE
jgi:23S rRNA (cytidine2498-2'-O)-methyltransferase